MIKTLFFDFRESEKNFFETQNHNDFDITFYKNNLTESTELSEEEYNETEVLSVFVCSQVTANVINKFKNLRVIATRSTGYNHIDLQTCIDRNISVVNIGGYGKRSVSQYTIAMIIGLVRNFGDAMKDFQSDKIDFNKYTGYELSELTLGVIGTGSIGAEVCRIADSFGMHIYAFDLKINPEIKDFVEYVTLEELYKHSNVITLHIPYTPEVYHMISDKEFEMMEDGVFIINSSRGEMIDNIALYEAVKSGKVRGAALDVLECENLNMYPDDFASLLKDTNCDCLGNAIVNQKLLALPNVIITPHIAYNTYHSINTILNDTFNNIKACFNGKCTNRIV